MDELVKEWLRDYALMMRMNLGALAESKMEGLYDGVVDRILEVEKYLRQPDSASGNDGQKTV